MQLARAAQVRRILRHMAALIRELAFHASERQSGEAARERCIKARHTTSLQGRLESTEAAHARWVELVRMLLVIGNKNYSSWSLRPWLAMKVLGLSFEEKMIALYGPGAKERILEY